jgi:hypothetical protein
MKHIDEQMAVWSERLVTELKITKVSLFLKPFKHGPEILRYLFTKYEELACKMLKNLQFIYQAFQVLTSTFA